MNLEKFAKILLVMFLWAICFPLIVAGSAHAPHLTFAALRALLAGAALLCAGIVLRRRWPRGRRVWLALSGVGLGATSLGFLGMFMASEFVSPGIATVIANAQPLMAAALAAVFLGEQLGWRGKVGLAMGFAGIILIAAPEMQTPAAGAYGLGIGYILLAALGITVSNVLIRAIVERVDLLMAMGVQMLIGAVPLIGGAAVFEDPFAIAFTPQFLAILVGLALFGSALAYWLWSDILRTTELGRANSFAFLVPVFGLAMGSAFFGETLNWLAVLGIAATLAGIALANSRRTTPNADTA
ncbi:DMT family transporter (plasmid) [Labrenzia sp. 5N]|jgi:drug/metabolite transporter (DMT)-like permease|uniref:DMT family transporter n=2 Tax=Hyphomicrobiales TaxID=356 RepID=UPI00094B117F|nr:MULTISPECIES: DMT family transporter [Roseibium]MBO9463313.1 DMT family transporter [Labrenzia sp. R5_0]NKX68173.1 DMT family transporter [Labrenzia sp. 5N]UES53825.1 EamA family transporter [Roseibium aggregatum]